ncbi:MAG: guanylate kinase [Oscillospiraceae bacterium]
MDKKGLLIVLIGPSGSGKGTVLKELLQTNNDIFLSISATTRSPRVGEINEKHYYFKTKQEFEQMLLDEQMLEYACYCDNYYGTPKAPVFERLQNGENVILEIEVQGARQIKQKYPDALLIFIIPPSLAELRKRLVTRNTEDKDVVEQRLKTALNEIKFAYDCDYIVVNENVSLAVKDILSIINAQQCSTNIMKELINEVLENA